MAGSAAKTAPAARLPPAAKIRPVARPGPLQDYDLLQVLVQCARRDALSDMLHFCYL